jgi:predicted acyltransferase
VLRGLDGFGNMALHRADNSFLQWLHVNKYPPSITYCTLELGLMALLLAGFFQLGQSGDRPWLKRLGVLGSNALFYYLLHVHLLMLAALALGVRQQLGLCATYSATIVLVAGMYFACRRYARYKAAHDNLLTRFV